MNRRSGSALLILLAFTAWAGLAFGPLSRADNPTKAPAAKKAKAEADKTRKADVNKMNAAIERNGKLPFASAKNAPAGDTYWSHAQKLYPGGKGVIAAVPLVKTRHYKSGKATTAALKSTLNTVGGEGLPDGFGKGFIWDRADNEVLLVLFINAADPLGISIEGVQSGDKVQLVSASGTASFSESSFKKVASSIVGLLAIGAETLKPEYAEAIGKAEKVVKEQFNPDVKTKCRDAFGVDPANGAKACQEGGLVVCLPEAGGTYYSGKPRGRWIQGKGDRTDEHRPAHVSYGGFFPIQGDPAHNTRTVRQSGPMYVLAWDHAFGDNAGYYKVFVRLTKGDGPIVEPNPLKKVPAAKRKPKP